MIAAKEDEKKSMRFRFVVFYTRFVDSERRRITKRRVIGNEIARGQKLLRTAGQCKDVFGKEGENSGTGG